MRGALAVRVIKDGVIMNLAFCDVFEMQSGKIRRLVSYLMEIR